jgi:hypothetical protein
MLSIRGKSLAALSRMWLCTVHFGILLIVIAALITAGELAVRADAADRVAKKIQGL